MTREECELSIVYLEGIKDNYIEGNGYERHPLPEYYAIETAIKALEQEPILDKIRAEIAMYEADCRLQGGTDECEKCNSNVFGSIYRIIDKCKAEREVQK